jgi:two-component system response regulator RegX3
MLRGGGYSVFSVTTGREGLEFLSEHQVTYGVILNAHSLRTKGTRICRSLRRNHPDLPILIITEETKPKGATLRLAPDFSARKLINRVERYAPLEEEDCLRCGQLVLDKSRDRVLINGRIRPLPGKLHEMLVYFLERQGKVVTQKELLGALWDTEYLGDINTLYTHISYLREVLGEHPEDPRYLTTVRGKGYRFQQPGAEQDG